MDWTWYLFRFKGRINRAKYWLAGLIIVCWMIFLAAIVVTFGARSFGFSVDDIFKAVDPDTYRALSRADIPLVLVKVIGTPVFAWVFAATSIKRLHDRDKSAWWALPFFVLPGLINQFLDRVGNDYISFTLALISFVLATWGGIELLFFRGSRKTNRFGADPLHVSPAGKPGRDQQRELEMPAQKAGPPPQWRVKPEA
ncbi:DUF805 domain-containing protein [Bradyrhizobium sp. INPA01-394B]|uniref:DUF805 domain-containing protein n=1 Tax=Bradyrhizobium campsiandrae TaxID=1729892 RepID=A0ABR7U6B5_9BRAD|nr:DUF805 domain-containing protein [Bradyrhizobium campsiandrae]MBC9880088.1 DUF805 domain-containing protein [Bradyrhizobium campsiandrae]MBC9978947.1 DUF805 domain-containing protein [Bradyrhizobium campsiandrae]